VTGRQCAQAGGAGGEEPGRGQAPGREDPGGGFELTGLEDGRWHGCYLDLSGCWMARLGTPAVLADRSLAYRHRRSLDSHPAI